MFKDDNTVVHFKRPLSKQKTDFDLRVYSPILGQRELARCDWQSRDQGA